MADWMHWIEHNGMARGIDADRLDQFRIASIGGKPTIQLWFSGRSEAIVVDDPVAFDAVLAKLQSMCGTVEIQNLYSGPRPA